MADKLTRAHFDAFPRRGRLCPSPLMPEDAMVCYRHCSRYGMPAYRMQSIGVPKHRGTQDLLSAVRLAWVPLLAARGVRAFSGRVGHYLFCSTVDVYAKPASRHPVREDEPRSPLTEYARKKVLCEDILLDAHRRGELPVAILRPAYTYGEGARGV